MAKFKVLKGFTYSHDGARTAQLNKGDEAEIRDDLVAGLTDAGHIAPAKVSKADADAAAKAQADAEAAAAAAAEAAKAAG